MIYEKMFGPTREMLVSDPRAFPEHRTAFYEFIKNLNATCFPALLSYLLQSDQLGLFLETVVLAVKNEHPQVGDLGLAILMQFLESLGKMNVGECGMIYARIFAPMTTVLLTVLTDKLHDSGKETQIKILMHLLSVVASRGLEPQLTLEQAESHVNSVLGSIGQGLVPAQRQAFVRVLIGQVGDVEAFRRLMNDLKITICYGGNLDL